MTHSAETTAQNELSVDGAEEETSVGTIAEGGIGISIEDHHDRIQGPLRMSILSIKKAAC